MLIVLLLMAVKQNDLVAATRHFLPLPCQSIVDEMHAGTGKHAWNRISFHDDIRDKFLQIFSFNGYVSRSAINTLKIARRLMRLATPAHAAECPADVNIALVTSKINILLPISRLSGAVRTCMVFNRTVRSNDGRLENLVCLTPEGNRDC